MLPTPLAATNSYDLLTIAPHNLCLCRSPLLYIIWLSAHICTHSSELLLGTLRSRPGCRGTLRSRPDCRRTLRGCSYCDALFGVALRRSSELPFMQINCIYKALPFIGFYITYQPLGYTTSCIYMIYLI